MTETTTAKPGISAAIIVSEGKVLMVRRRISEGELMWQFPAGAIENGSMTLVLVEGSVAVGTDLDADETAERLVALVSKLRK